ncbi:cytochrome P450, partial [Conidiobolus coronatus NRRL 28638]
FIILYAGLDTASNTMTWTLFEILNNPKVYDLIKSEILSNFPDLTKPLNISDCESKLKYLEAAIWESMRKHPVVEMFARRVPSEGVTIGDHYLPEKTVITLNLYAYHNNPKIWKNPREFKINRWLGEEREKSMENFIGFGSGPRSCIGKDLAWAELFLVLANLIR